MSNLKVQTPPTTRSEGASCLLSLLFASRQTAGLSEWSQEWKRRSAFRFVVSLSLRRRRSLKLPFLQRKASLRERSPVQPKEE